jgi:hypothetical protein
MSRLKPSAVLAIASIGLVAACGDQPLSTKPSPISPSAFAGIQVVGPDAVASGQSVQFVANISQADGTMKSATSMPNLRWFSSNNSVAVVSQSGIVTASPSVAGQAVITAEFADRTTIRGTREVVTQPEGTYRIAGSVFEADAPTVPVAGARVEAIPGSRSTVTDSTGHYLLFAVPPQASIRITAAGYETLNQSLDLNANASRDFGLNTDGRRLVLNGPYTIAVDVASPCSLNSTLQHRAYDAVLTTTGTLVDVALTEPRFRLDQSGRGNHFPGRLLAGGATFTLDYFSDGSWADYQYPTLAERLGDNTYLVIEGTATTSGSATGLIGTLSGDISNWDSRFPVSFMFPNSGYLGECTANIQFRVTAR